MFDLLTVKTGIFWEDDLKTYIKNCDALSPAQHCSVSKGRNHSLYVQVSLCPEGQTRFIYQKFQVLFSKYDTLLSQERNSDK